MQQQIPGKPQVVPGVPKPKLTPKQLVKDYLDKGKSFLALAKTRLDSDPSMKRMLMLAGGVLGVIFLLILVAGIAQRVMRGGGAKETPSPSAEFTPTPGPTIFNPSRYATDSAVLSLEESIKGINRDAESLDIREYNLKPPSLDFDINFEATE